MAKNSRFPAEWQHFRDARTGCRGKQLTNYKGHSHHLYFTNSGWYTHTGRQKLLFGSDRCNETNLFSLDLDSGEITQLTDSPTADSAFLYSSVSSSRPEVYFWRDHTLIALDLDTLAERPLYRVPEGYDVNLTSVTIDGKYVCTGIYEDLSRRFKIDLLHGYVGFAEYWQAMPHSQIVRIATEDGKADVVFEEDYWIGHVGASPSQSAIVMFCHEGPWDKVDHRVWALDMRDGRVWKIRPADRGEQVGHEYWFADGEHIGYHGQNDLGQSFYGSIRFDNVDQVEAPFSRQSMHFHSNDLQLIVGDGTRDAPELLLWRLHEGRFEGPRTVLVHHGTFQIQQLHVHPRFSPDGNQILYTSDASGYGNIFLVDTPDFDALPESS